MRMCIHTYTKREREREDSGLRCDTLCMLYVCSRPSATELNAGEYWAKVRVQNPLKVERRVATSGWRFVPEIRLKRFWGLRPEVNAHVVGQNSEKEGVGFGDNTSTRYRSAC